MHGVLKHLRPVFIGEGVHHRKVAVAVGDERLGELLVLFGESGGHVLGVLVASVRYGHVRRCSLGGTSPASGPSLCSHATVSLKLPIGCRCAVSVMKAK